MELHLCYLQELGTDVNLYALVFGESVLNDAVSSCCWRMHIIFFSVVQIWLKIDSANWLIFFIVFSNVIFVFSFVLILPLVLWADGYFFVQVPECLKYMAFI